MTVEKNEFGQLVGRHVNESPAKKPGATSLLGRYCSLVPINVAQHAEPLFKNLMQDNRGESWTYLPYGPFHDIEPFRAWLTATCAEHDTQLYAVLTPAGEPVGIAGYLRITPQHSVIEVGHLHYSVFLQKTPAATEAMYLLMRYAFDTLGYRRYEWKCNALNEGSRKAALRLGFTYEGTFRQHNVFKQRNRDTLWFSILDSEWPAIKKNFERWLAPENFDATGQQLTSFRNH